MKGHSKLYQLIPVLDWIRTYSPADFKGDLNAGITVGIMLIPQGMAYAVLAGLPPVYGLYASITPLIFYAVFGTSRHLAVGPAAILSLLILTGIGQFADIGSSRFIQLAILTSFGVGLFQFLMGIFRMGFIVNFLSQPVLSGFISAAALIIVASQIRNLLGIDLPQTNRVLEIAAGIPGKISGTDFFTALIGTGSIILIIVMQKWKRTFPAALVVVVAGILITALFRLDRHGVSIVGDIPRGLPTFDISGFNPSDLQLIFPLIVVIALVSYIESIAIAKAIAKKHGYQIDSNQELIALGFAKIGSSLFQAFPTTGGFSRSAVNEQAGGRTGMSSVFSALIIILTVLFLTPLLHYLPNAVLAAIIIVAVAGLFDTGEIANLWRTDKKDLAMLLTTFLVTLGVGIEEGIVVGVVLSLGVVIYSSTRPHSAELGRLGNTRNFRNVKRYSEASVDEDILIFRFDSPLYFASAENFRETLETMILQKGPGLKLVILDASSINHIDSTGIHTMKELIRDLRLRQIALFITSAIGPVRDKLKTTGIIKSVGRQNFFFDIEDAVSYYQKEGVEDSDYSPLQTNI